MQPHDALYHYGVKGMKWGVRRHAKKDAREFTKARMFYGEGAGTRRKLIKAKVEARSKKDKDYVKAFNYYVEKTDLGKRASQARTTRARKDTVKTAGKTARGVKNLAGYGGVTIGALGVFTVLNNPTAQAKITSLLGTSFTTLQSGYKYVGDEIARRMGARNLKKKGFGI